ncbi:MAG: helix-turn-helix transcriptional regulator [Clostridia bacterium]|nr:helix-turn-helix transcriptional regulator [Clostridia bacterium]
MSEKFMNENSIDNIIGQHNYAVAFAERRDIGEEWNRVEWNVRHHHIGLHRLYFRTDTTGCRAVVHLTDCELELLPGYVYFVPAYSVRQSELEGEMSKYYIHFQADSLIFDLYRYLSGKYSVPADHMTEALFQTVIQNYTRNSPDAFMRVQGAMSLLLSSFFAEPFIDRKNLVRFEGVLHYIRAHFREKITLSELSSLMNISTMYFSNSFKSAFHISPKQYILNMRLTESQRLLLQTDLSVKEIAYAVGFDNENYFSEFFAAKMGMSALKFRNRDLPRSMESLL